MSQFIRHTNCERCGSSDAMALYKGGGGFCFSCRRSLAARTSPYAVTTHDVEDEEAIKLPSDAGFDYPSHCLEWVFKYGLSVNELIQNKVYWSGSRQQLLFTFWGNSSSGTPELLLYQARNFGQPKDGRRQLKYYTKGRPEELLPLYPSRTLLVSMEQARVIVLVEDCVSAIRISRQAHAMPVLGSDLSLGKLKRLAGSLDTLLDRPKFYDPWCEFSKVVIWLDSDMYSKAQRMAQRLQMLGVSARAVYTDLDPKEYDDETIKEILLA